MSNYSRPESSASMNDSNFATAPNTPIPTPTHEPGGFQTQNIKPQGSNTHLPLLAAGAAGTSVPAPEHGSSSPRGTHTPLPAAGDTFFDPPRASYLENSQASTPRQSYGPSSFNDSSQRLAEKPEQFETEDHYPSSKRKSLLKRPVFWISAGAAVVIIALAVGLGVHFATQKNNNSAASSSSPGSSPSSGGGGSGSSPSGATTGGDGSVITMEGGGTFTYQNSFGGYWVDDPNDPFNNNARPNSWTPPLNISWNWGVDKVNGVNLGGLFVLEPFISPALFQKYPGTIDEWSLSTAMANDTASGGLNQLEDHYSTFITEQDMAEIAGAGLNWVRLPIPFWCIETWEGEPFLAKVSWKYILRVLGWARKYGLRVNLDLHTIPGSQNGYNHSGKFGQVDFLNGVMGVANAQRTLNYIRIITEFISQPEYKDVVPLFGMVNEALLTTIGREQLSAFYLEAHNMIRGITGVGEGNGPYISVHDGFAGVSSWADFMPGSDRVILDTHPYFAFDGQPNTAPIATGTGSGAGGVWPAQACNSWGKSLNSSRSNFGVTIAGEWSQGFNDCGLFVKGVNVPSQYATLGGNCDIWQDSTNWNSSLKAGLSEFALASMDALQDWFFWTWKVGNSTSGIVEAPLWSYQLALQGGWMPTDPRKAVGACAAQGVVGSQFDGTFSSWQTGGAGAGTIAASWTASYGQWPPTSINGLAAGANAAQLPMYTSTGTVATLPPPTLTASATQSIDVGDGWYNTADTASGVTTIQGCTYPNAWDAVSIAVPSACKGAGAAVAARAAITPPPAARR